MTCQPATATQRREEKSWLPIFLFYYQILKTKWYFIFNVSVGWDYGLPTLHHCILIIIIMYNCMIAVVRVRTWCNLSVLSPHSSLPWLTMQLISSRPGWWGYRRSQRSVGISISSNIIRWLLHPGQILGIQFLSAKYWVWGNFIVLRAWLAWANWVVLSQL